MNNPWDIRTDEPRAFDGLINFIIFCEDEVSEPNYLRQFETSKIKVNCILGQSSMMDHVLKAINKCISEGLLDPTDSNSKLPEDSQVWCAFDRDKEETEEKIEIGNTNFDESIKTAIQRGFKMAWSNDSFELWVLLHFEEVAGKTERVEYYSRLTDIFKTLPNPNQSLSNINTSPHFSYKKYCKTRKNFIKIVRPELMNKVKDAIMRAEALEASHSGKAANHLKTSCTMMHHLVKTLIELG